MCMHVLPLAVPCFTDQQFCHVRPQRQPACSETACPPPSPSPVSVFLYALLTVLFTLAGLAYIVLPQLTLKWTFGWAAAGGSMG